MIWTSASGYGAATLSTLSFAPQAWKIIKSRETEDISVGMYLLTVAGFVAWIIYGVMIHTWPIVGSNVICLALSVFILTMKLLPQKRKEEVAAKVEQSF
jgi:MtN3 and saliva related transmembrane protein